MEQWNNGMVKLWSDGHGTKKYQSWFYEAAGLGRCCGIVCFGLQNLSEISFRVENQLLKLIKSLQEKLARGEWDKSFL
jgi:hypothetical protein